MVLNPVPARTAPECTRTPSFPHLHPTYFSISCCYDVVTVFVQSNSTASEIASHASLSVLPRCVSELRLFSHRRNPFDPLRDSRSTDSLFSHSLSASPSPGSSPVARCFFSRFLVDTGSQTAFCNASQRDSRRILRCHLLSILRRIVFSMCCLCCSSSIQSRKSGYL